MASSISIETKALLALTTTQPVSSISRLLSNLIVAITAIIGPMEATEGPLSSEDLSMAFLSLESTTRRVAGRAVHGDNTEVLICLGHSMRCALAIGEK